MADLISCEGWDTGKPFLGVPSKFVVINEDGEEVGTLADLLPMLLYAANNLQDLENAETARENLGVYSKSEIENAINDATPSATTAVEGVVKLTTVAEALNKSDESKAVTPKGLESAISSRTIGNGNLTYDYTSRILNTLYTNETTTALLISISATISTAGTYLQVKNILDNVQISSNSAPAGGQVFLCFVVGPGESYKVVQVGSGTVTINKWIGK